MQKPTKVLREPSELVGTPIRTPAARKSLDKNVGSEKKPEGTHRELRRGGECGTVISDTTFRPDISASMLWPQCFGIDLSALK